MADDIAVTSDSESDQAAVLFGEVIKAVADKAMVRAEGRDTPLFFPKGIDQIYLSFIIGKATISLNISGTTCCKTAAADVESETGRPAGDGTDG